MHTRLFHNVHFFQFPKLFLRTFLFNSLAFVSYFLALIFVSFSSSRKFHSSSILFFSWLIFIVMISFANATSVSLILVTFKLLYLPLTMSNVGHSGVSYIVLLTLFWSLIFEILFWGYIWMECSHSRSLHLPRFYNVTLYFWAFCSLLCSRSGYLILQLLHVYTRLECSWNSVLVFIWSFAAHHWIHLFTRSLRVSSPNLPTI